MIEENILLCPSSGATDGSLLVGVIMDNSVTLLETPLEVDNVFIELAQKSLPLEKRFRFATKCIASCCRNWTGTRCGVMELLSESKHLRNEDILNPCSIRERCQWYHQDGGKACNICTYVVSNNMEENESLDIPEPLRMQEINS